MKLDPDKPITCEAAEDAVIVGPVWYSSYLVYSLDKATYWSVNMTGQAREKGLSNKFDVRNVPEKTAEHWIEHNFDWYTHHWIEDGEPKCEIVKTEKGGNK